MQQNKILIYQDDNGITKVNVRFSDDRTHVNIGGASGKNKSKLSFCFPLGLHYLCR